MDEAIDEILEKLPQVNDLIDSVEPGIDDLIDSLDGLRDNVKRFLNNKEVRNYQHEFIILR